MPATSIIINSTDGNGKSVQKALTYVNPNATNAELATFGQMYTATQRGHTYGNTYRVDKIDCDNYEKATTSITALGNAEVAQSDIAAAGATGVKVATFVGTAMTLLTPDSSFTLRLDGNDAYICQSEGGDTLTRDLDIFLYIPETITQKSASRRIVIQA